MLTVYTYPYIPAFCYLLECDPQSRVSALVMQLGKLRRGFFLALSKPPGKNLDGDNGGSGRLR